MLRNFVQIMRSGVVGRKSLGTQPKRLIRNWLESRSDEQLFHSSVDNAPSLADVVKTVHPIPQWQSREALFGWLIGRDHNAEALPEIVRQYEKFKHVVSTGNRPHHVPDVPFQMLTSLKLQAKEWKVIAKNASWQMTRMNLNTFARHGVLDDRDMVKLIAERLRNAELIAKARVFPYQLMMAYTQATDVPREIREALQDAMEIAIQNVPKIDGKVYVCPDVSGSMHSPVTGHRQGASSAVRCIDVAALVAAAMLRKNPSTEVIPFHDTVVRRDLNPRDSVMTNAKTLASIPSGGTNCSAPLVELNRVKAKGDLVIYVSDNESWVDSPHYGRYGGNSATQTMQQWAEFKRRSPNAKMICIDIQPYAHTQAKERDDIVNIGGFSDQVFTLIAETATGNTKDHWVNTINKIEL
jgi:60 kDa SS-A/Ro ribonucleoprotein